MDVANGAVVLTFTDLVLPGNAGRELRFQRTYNSKGSRTWTFGIAGMVMSVFDGWPLGAEEPLAGQLDVAPTLTTADGGEHRAALWLNPENQGAESFRMAGTDTFWRYDRKTRSLWMPDGTISQFDAQGRLISNVDAFGNTVTLTWQTGQVTITQTVGGASRQVVLALASLPDPNSWLPNMPVSMTFEGRTWDYQGAPLTAVVPPVGPGWAFAYEQDALTLTTPHGGTVRYEYATEEFQQAGGSSAFTTVLAKRIANDGTGPATWTYNYALPGAGPATQTEIVAPRSIGGRTTFDYEWRGDGANNAAQLAYQGRTYLLTQRSVFDATGVELEREVLDYVYKPVPSRNTADALPAMSERQLIREPQGSNEAFTTTYEYRTTDFADYHRPSEIEETGDLTRTTTRTYQHLATPYVVGLPLTETVTVGTESFARSWAYDVSTGFRTSETVAGIATTFAADSAGNVASVTKANGKWTTFGYSYGQVSRTTTPEHVTTRVINSDGTVASETQGGRTTSYAFDALGRPLTVQPPGATAAIVYSYDNTAGSWAKTTRGTSITTSTLDGFGRVVETTDSLGVRTVSTYDSTGRPTFQSYPFTGTGNGVGTSIEYDGLDRVVRETNADSTHRERTYGPGTVTVRDENGHDTVYTRAAFGHPEDTRLVGVLDPAEQQWTYTYNVAGALTTVSGPGGVTRTWTYNAKHLLATETHPESGTVSYTEYDAAGVLKRKTDARGTVFQYAHDANDRLRSITAGNRVTQIAYEAGTDNRAQASISGGVSTSFRYDAAGRLEFRTDGIDGRIFATRYEYDQNDNLAALTYPSGRRVAFDHDDEGRITGVRRPATNQSYASGIGHHASGAMTAYAAGNGVTTSVGIHAQRYWVSSIQAGALQLTYQYDDAGNVTGITDPRPGMSQLFEYDALDRLTSASGIYGSLTYSYDAHGNRQGADYTYVSGNPFRLASFAGNAVGYDANGNTTSAGATYAYTPDNLIDESTAGGLVTQYAYDADAWRVKKAVGGGPATYYVRGPGGQLLSEVEIGTASTTTRDYIYAGSRLVSVAVSEAAQP